jgi:RNA polymerase sigma-70 factor (ECF subfamily)
MKHFLANEWHRARTRKRGGHVRLIEWDGLDPEARYASSAASTTDPDAVFDREWALATVATALESLRTEMVDAGKGRQFDALKGALTGDDDAPRDALAARLGMSEGAVKVAVHRLRRRYRELLRATIAETVRDEANLDDEMRHLLAVLRGL